MYDDPILKSNEERFLNQFKIIDDDADYASFDLSQQLFLDEYLNKAKSNLEKINSSENNNYEDAKIKELVDEIDQIKTSLTMESKNMIIHRLAKFWRKAQKIGLEIIKEVFISVAAELTKKLITGQ